MNLNKCHLLLVGHKLKQVWAKIGADLGLLLKSNSVKLLLIAIDNYLKFDKNISRLCARAKKKKFLLLLGFPTTSLFIKKEH